MTDLSQETYTKILDCLKPKSQIKVLNVGDQTLTEQKPQAKSSRTFLNILADMFIGSKQQKEPEEPSSCDFSGQEENVSGSKKSYTFEGELEDEEEQLKRPQIEVNLQRETPQQ